MRILVVDDSEDFRDLTEGALLSAGYTDIVTASSGWEAMKILDVGRATEEKPTVDVALLDIVMPEMDGVEACARIRNDSRYGDLPIIMVTSLDDMNSLSNAFVAGATDYVTKPINRVELIARVRAALQAQAGARPPSGARASSFCRFCRIGAIAAPGCGSTRPPACSSERLAEAYLTTACGCRSGEEISVVALTLDRFDAYSATNGDAAARGVIAEVARAVRRLAATIGVVAASYRNGMIILVAPEIGTNAARELGETLRTTVAKLHVANSESVVSDYVTASVVAVTGQVKRAVDRVHLLTQAISRVQDAAAAGGDRVLALTA